MIWRKFIILSFPYFSFDSSLLFFIGMGKAYVCSLKYSRDKLCFVWINAWAKKKWNYNLYIYIYYCTKLIFLFQPRRFYRTSQSRLLQQNKKVFYLSSCPISSSIPGDRACQHSNIHNILIAPHLLVRQMGHSYTIITM